MPPPACGFTRSEVDLYGSGDAKHRLTASILLMRPPAGGAHSGERDLDVSRGRFLLDGIRPLCIPVVLGTVRKGRMSAHAARFMTAQIAKRPGIVTELVDVAALGLPLDDAGEGIKDAAMSEKLAKADGLVLVSPEYNHSFPGVLKHFLDGYLKEYIHKAVGVVGVSAGPFGGARGIQDLLPVLRELGLVSIFWDVNIGTVGKVFDEAGGLLDQALIRRSDKFLDELVWMSRTLRYGRDNIALN
jgi:NAD(P)H-dependent FMN reductase